jgi:hypothetical protein
MKIMKNIMKLEEPNLRCALQTHESQNRSHWWKIELKMKHRRNVIVRQESFKLLGNN